MIAKVLHDLCFSLNQSLKLAWWSVWWNIQKCNKTFRCSNFSCLVSINWPCNVTRCWLGGFDMIFVTLLLKSNIHYVLPQGQPLPQKNSGCTYGGRSWRKNEFCAVPIYVVHYGHIDHKLILLSDEPCFLSQYMHELFRGKSFSNLICEELLLDDVIGVWPFMSATSIIAPICFLSHTDMLRMIWSHVLKKYSIMM